MVAKTAMKACCLLLISFFSFTVKAQLVANFRAFPTSGCAPLVVHFTDLTTGTPTNWKWDLGNGTISFLKNPSVTYFNPGLYTIKLIAKNASNTDSVIKTSFIRVLAKPTVAFSASSTTGCFPLPVQFTDQSGGIADTIVTWQWDFGDGFTSNLQHPFHIYNSGGNFNVSLKISNSSGCISSLTKPQLIQISAGAIANFSNSVPNSCAIPASINFQNLSTGTGTLSYKWFFGDGDSSTLLNPSHVYSNRGSFDVMLIVTNSGGCTDTLRKRNAISLGSVAANFTLTNAVCQNSPVSFTNTSSPVPASVIWSFGDGSSANTLNATKAYTTSGNFTVKMVANFGACADSTTQIVTILPKPTVAFSVDDSTSCKIPFTVNFIDQTTNGSTYSWSFGDNSTSALQNPSHTYSAFGAYTVKLKVTNVSGCVDSVVKTNYINVVQSRINMRNIPDSGCAPFTKNFTATAITVDPIANLFWNLGDGTTTFVRTPTHTYDSIGIYTVSVILTTASGCKDTSFVSRAIIVTNKPTPIFSASPRNTCANSSVNFSDQTPGNNNRWLWSFGDGNYSTAQNPSHQYTDTGFFTIKLFVWNGGCVDSIIVPNYVYIKPPIAKFIVQNNCSSPLERVFLDKSIGADDWLWNFGDGTTSTLQSPTHVYSAAGSYTVSLKVTNRSTGCEYTTTTIVLIVDAKAQFTASDTIVCRGSNVIFTTGLSLTDVTTFNWNFGDGTPSINSPSVSNGMTHLFNRSGIFDVRLTITDVTGCSNQLIKTAYIKVNGPIAKFTPTGAGSCLNKIVVFTDSSQSDGTNALQSWKWNYGDGITDSLTTGPFQHIYSSVGLYNVKLKVTDTKGCTDSFMVPTPFVVSKPVANFISPDTINCPSQLIHFTDSSTGPGLIYNWSFGDGNSSTAQNPSNNYLTLGIFSVKLFIKDQYGCRDSISRPNYINITKPIVNFSMSDSAATCPPLIVQFVDSSNFGTNKVWDFGDSTSAITGNPSHFYSLAGTYIVKLTVTGRGGCTSTMQKTINIKGPRGTFIYPPTIGCNPVTVDFAASSYTPASFIWDFNDGTLVTNADSMILHQYNFPGVYVPKMILKDSSGCQVPIIGRDTIVVNGITARFNFINRTICDSGYVSFIDSSWSNDVISNYNWTFGDGSSSNLPNPVHQYNTNGLHTPKLIITTQHGCVDSTTASLPIKIVASPKINMVFSGNGCAPLTATFNGQQLVPDTSALNWRWIFGNGNFSFGPNPLQQRYDTTGVYTVQLIALNSSGCSDTATKNIEAYLVPLVTVGADKLLCQGSTLTLTATGADDYSWSPSTALSCRNCAAPITNTSANIEYIVTGTTIHGCSAKDTVAVTVKNKWRMTYSRPAEICVGSSKKISAAGTDKYSWTPAAALSNPTNAEQNVRPDSSTTYRVIGSDNEGCFKDTGYIFIKVYPYPTVEAGVDKTINVGQSLDLMPVISPDVVEVAWFPTDGLFRNTYPGITVKPTQNMDYTVEVKNRGGCMARDKVSVFVVCNGANVFIPNTFSPDGNNVNDIFYPRGSGIFKIKQFRIWSRWGELLFEKNSFNANDPTFGWDGTFKGKKLNSDIYIYTIDVICDNKTVLPYKGNVALVR